MHIGEITDALSADAADPEAVLAQLRTKARRRHRRRLAVGTGLVSVGVIGLLVIVIGTVFRPHPTPARRAAAPLSSDPVVRVVDACAGQPVPELLGYARSVGASVVTGTGVLTGKTAQDRVGGPSTALSGALLDQMILTGVRTLSGPAVADHTTGWLSGERGVGGPMPGGNAGALWAPDGRLFAIVLPQAATGTSVGPILRVAPLVDGRVVFSDAGCWSTDGLSGQPFTGPLAEIPGSDSFSRAARSPSGFTAVPLSAIEKLIVG